MYRADVVEMYLTAIRRALLSAAATVTFLVSVPNAGAACNASGPSMLGLFLTGRGLSDAVHGQLMEAASRDSTAEGVKSLAALGHALGALNTQVWGLYWISLYSRRLHEMLERPDSKPPGPVTRYYDRWDGSQINGSVANVTRDADAVDALLARTRVLSQEQSAAIQQHLGRVREELQGCITEQDPLSNYPPAP